MATVVDVGGATYPKEFQGHAILPMEGKSLRPALANQPLEGVARAPCAAGTAADS